MGYDSSVGKSVALASRLGLVGAVLGASVAGACGFDGAGTQDLAAAAADASPGADASLPPGAGAADGEAPGASDGSAADATDSSIPFADSATAYSTRVKTNLVALYEFEENMGKVVHDAVAQAVDLVIRDGAKAVWKPHALTFVSYTVAETKPTNVTKILTACKASNELTVEAWIEPELMAEDARTRIVTMATSNSNLNFALGADTTDGTWASVQSNNNLTPATKLTKKLTHLVMTRSADSALRLYVDGVKVTEELTGTPSMNGWADTALFVGNSSSVDRAWLGSIHLLAIYSKALDLASILQNKAAGADP